MTASAFRSLSAFASILTVHLVRIRSVRIRFFILSAIAILTALLPAARLHAADDPVVARAMPEIARMASEFWHAAPDYMARETMKQKAITVPKKHGIRMGSKA